MKKIKVKLYKAKKDTDKNLPKYNIKIIIKKKTDISTASKIINEIKNDVDAIYMRDPAARNRFEVLTLYSGLHALLMYRMAHKLNNNGLNYLARLLSQGAKFITGIEIHPGAEIGQGLFIDHGSGVVIGETTIIGDNCTLYQGVTLGGTGKETGKRHPTLGNNVMVGAGAKLLGAFTVGNNSKIAAGAVVLSDVPENCTAVGIPAKIVVREGVRVNDVIELDQVHIPDPTGDELMSIKTRLDSLEAAFSEMSNGTADNDASQD